jgi:hypothetical protein
VLNVAAANARPCPKGENMIMNNQKLTILYSRLSKEDERENESLSIENQKRYLLCLMKSKKQIGVWIRLHFTFRIAKTANSTRRFMTNTKS